MISGYVAHASLLPMRRGLAPSFVNYKKGALDSQSQMIKFTSCVKCLSNGRKNPITLKDQTKKMYQSSREICLRKSGVRYA